MKTIKIRIGTLFGAGLLPKAPGTWGSFLFLPVISITGWSLPLFGIPLLLLVTSLLSIWSAQASVETYGDDPPQFVMDECTGQTLVFLFTAFSFSSSGEIWILLTGFALFRLFDIYKPLGIDSVQQLPGKFGILADDLLAGLYALCCLEFIKYMTAIFF